MAPVVSMAPREASAPGRARGLRRPGSCRARAGRRSAASVRGWAGRPARSGQGRRRAQHVVGGGGRGLGPERESRSSRSRRLESGLCLRPAGSCSAEAAAWAGQRSLEPGRREAARAPAWLPGRRAGKVKGTCHPWDLSIREAYGQDSGTSGRRPGMSDFREKPECEDPCSVSVGS